MGVIGYGGRVAWAWGGKLAGQKLVPISVVANNPLRIEQRKRGEQKFKVPVWFEAVAGGRTPMCQAITEAASALAEFIRTYPNSYPSMVFNITDGKATDGNPELPAFKLRALKTTDGNVLFFNAHLSSKEARPIEYPSSATELPDAEAVRLFKMSSVLPPKWREAARAEKFKVNENTRGFVFNADLNALIRFLDIGTRPNR